MTKWKGFGRKRSWPNRDIMPGESEFTLEPTMKAQKGSRDIPLLFLQPRR
jgi:hypothetical protein